MRERTRASALVGVAFCAGGLLYVMPAWAQRPGALEHPAEEAPLGEVEAEARLRHELEKDPWIALEEVEVDVEDGVARVSGQVDELLARERVTWIADRIPGIDEVVNEVVVGDDPPTEAQIGERVVETVESLGVEGDAIYTEVTDGVVSLYGAVADAGDGAALVEAIEALPGVREVESWLRVEETVTPSDEALYVQIWRRLLLDPVVDVRNVAVTARGREVLLSGIVGSLEARQRAIRAAWTEGAEDVFAENLEVDPGLGVAVPEISDRVLAQEVALELMATPWAEGADVEVAVDDDVVTLLGEVPTLLARAELARAAAELPGVDEVVAALEVVPPFRAWEGALQDAIEAKLREDPLLVEGQVRVEAEDGGVRLTGVVPSRYERERVETAVASVLGVRRIDNDLRVRGAREASERRLARYFEQRLAQVADLEGASIRMTLTPEGMHLDGVAETERARAAAERIAKDISVRPVVNQIRVG